MALQDQTLANTMAKVGMEAKRRRNTEMALAAMQPGVRQRGELPWWANVPTGPSMYRTPAAPGWLMGASEWFRDPGYSREAVVPGASLVDYARTVAEGGRPSIPQTIAAGLDVPVPGLSAAEETLGGLGALLLGVTRRAGTPPPVARVPEEGVARSWLNQVDVAPEVPMVPQPRTRGAEYLRAFERRKNRGRMEYVGAPPGVQGPKDIEALVEKYASNIETALDAGVPAGYFYREGTEDIARVTETPEQAAVLAQGIGITSSEAPVASNVDWTLRGMEQQAMGLPLRTGLYPNKMRGPLTQVAQGEVPSLGVKRGRYAAGLYGGEASGMDVLAPNDRWEARTVGFKVGEEGKGGISPTNARFIDRVRAEAVRRVNERRGLSLRPLEGQELNWIVERSGASGAAGAMPTIGIDRPTSTIGGALEARTMGHQYPPQFSPVFTDPVTGKDPLISAMGGQFQVPATPGESYSLVSATQGGVDPASEARVRATESMRGLMTGRGSYVGQIPESSTFPRGHEVSGSLPEGRRTATVLESLSAAPNLETLADSPQTRAVMGRMADAGVSDEATRQVLTTWAREGLAGVRRLVEAGVAPVVVLGILSRESTPEQTPGGQTGAPAGSGLPMLGV